MFVVYQTVFSFDICDPFVLLSESQLIYTIGFNEAQNSPPPFFVFAIFITGINTRTMFVLFFFKGTISNMTLTFRLVLITFSKRLFGWCWRFLFILLTDFVCELPVSLVYVL